MASISRATTDAALVRTDYSNQRAWEVLLEGALAETEDGFRAYVEIIDDPTLDALDVDGVQAELPDDYEHSFVIIADHMSMTAPEHALLVIDLVDDPGRTFRAVPAAIQAIDNNLAIANMFFSDFAENVDPDGIFRGFPPAP